MENRIVKVPLPVDLIRRMDEALAEGRGGLETRAAFIREASENLLAEVTYADAPPERAESGHGQDQGGDVSAQGPSPDREDRIRLPAAILSSIPSWEQDELRLADLAGTALPTVSSGATLDSGVAQFDEEPLLGIHNRDYPSLWAANRLARYTEGGLIAFDDFRIRATNAAWLYAEQLGALEDQLPRTRLTALFPSNPEKRDSAERAFQTFAIGVVSRRPPREGPIKAGGPLFVWRICQLRWEDGTLMVGLTASGRALLEKLVGISLELPHAENVAEEFFSHLIRESPGERWGFDQVIKAAAARPDRRELVSIFSKARVDWTPATASSVAQGYVARAREWGLLTPRLDQGRYSLTDFGRKCQGYMSISQDGPNSANREESQ